MKKNSFTKKIFNKSLFFLIFNLCVCCNLSNKKQISAELKAILKEDDIKLNIFLSDKYLKLKKLKNYKHACILGLEGDATSLFENTFSKKSKSAFLAKIIFSKKSISPDADEKENNNNKSNNSEFLKTVSDISLFNFLAEYFPQLKLSKEIDNIYKKITNFIKDKYPERIKELQKTKFDNLEGCHKFIKKTKILNNYTLPNNTLIYFVAEEINKKKDSIELIHMYEIYNNALKQHIDFLYKHHYLKIFKHASDSLIKFTRKYKDAFMKIAAELYKISPEPENLYLGYDDYMCDKNKLNNSDNGEESDSDDDDDEDSDSDSDSDSDDEEEDKMMISKKYIEQQDTIKKNKKNQKLKKNVIEVINLENFFPNRHYTLSDRSFFTKYLPFLSYNQLGSKLIERGLIYKMINRNCILFGTTLKDSEPFK